MVSFGSKDKMIVDFYMTRSLFTVFMVTYLPTVLMNVMNQAVVYIRMENKFELIISVNILVKDDLKLDCFKSWRPTIIRKTLGWKDPWPMRQGNWIESVHTYYSS